MWAQLCHVWQCNWSHDTTVHKFQAIVPSSCEPCQKKNYLKKGLPEEAMIGICLYLKEIAILADLASIGTHIHFLVQQLDQQWHVLSHSQRTCDM